MQIEPCPNPDCDEEEGCCVCEHTGRVYSYVLDEVCTEDEKGEG